jgi:plasmid stabilization system protein ParE
MEVIYLRRAIADERREAAFWEERSPMLKDEFLVEMERSIETIRRTPEGYAIVEKPHGLRRFVEKRFQTGIYYRYSKESDVLVLARIQNCRMNPKKLLD